MYRLSLNRDQQHSTTLSITSNTTTVIVKTHRITPNTLPSTHNKLVMDFSIHESHEQSGKWGALQHWLRVDFEQLVHGQMLACSVLKVHIFILVGGADLQSVIFNGVWLNLLAHGLPLKRSVLHHHWNNHNQAVFDLHSPSTILSGHYNSPPPPQIHAICNQYKQLVTDFMRKEWAR